MPPGTIFRLGQTPPLSGAGRYDIRGCRFHGRQFSEANGRFVSETILPDLYPGHVRNFHVKGQPPGGKVLTTLLYFPRERGDRRTEYFSGSLVMRVKRADDGLIDRFDFVVEAGEPAPANVRHTVIAVWSYAERKSQ